MGVPVALSVIKILIGTGIHGIVVLPERFGANLII